MIVIVNIIDWMKNWITTRKIGSSNTRNYIKSFFNYKIIKLLQLSLTIHLPFENSVLSLFLVFNIS